MLGCGGKREQERGRDRRNLLISRAGEAWSESANQNTAGPHLGNGGDLAVSCQLVIAGCTSETAKTEEGEHTLYCLRCVMVGCKGKERITWEVRRRYREFFSLHTRMKAYGAVHAELPSRNPFALMSSVIHAREKGLQEYLNQVLERCSDDQCHLLAKFLQVNKHMSRSTKANSAHSNAHVSKDSTPASSRAETPDAGLRPKPFANLNSTPGPALGAGLVPASSTADRKRSQSCPRGALRPGRAEGNSEGAAARGGGGAADDSAVRGGEGRGGMAAQQQVLLSGLRQQRAGRAGAAGAGGGVEAKAGVGLFFVESAGGECEVDEIICGSSADADGSIQVGDVLRAVEGAPLPAGHCDLARVREMIIGAPDSLVTLSFQRTRQYQPVSHPAPLAPHRYDVTLVRSLRRAPSAAPSPPASADSGSVGPQTPQHDALPTPRLLAHLPPRHCAEGPSPAAAAKPEEQAAGAGCGEVKGGERRASEASQGGRGGLRQLSGVSGGSLSGAVAAEGSEVATVKAVCAFEAQKPHELSLQPGELVIILRRHHSGWWEGCTVAGGRRGWLPSNHVAEIDARGIVMESALRATTASDQPRQSHAGSSSSGQSLSVAQTVMANLSTTSADTVGEGEVLSKQRVEEWGVEEVCGWLAGMELGEYAEVFRANKIDGELLRELQDKDLRDDFGIANKYHRRRLLKRLHG